MVKSERKELETFIINEIGEFVEREGFSHLKIERGGVYTSFYWFSEAIAVEVKVDWRDYYASTMIVKHENQILPELMYYVDGKPVRKYLYTIIAEQKWATSGKTIVPGKGACETLEEMKQEILIEKKNLETYMADIKANWRQIFSVPDRRRGKLP